MIITAVFVHAVLTGSVEFGFVPLIWMVVTAVVDVAIAQEFGGSN